jgi:hypothetical protein
MSLFTIIAVIVIVGVVLYLINQFIPMEPRIKQILNIAVIIILVLWLLSIVFGFDLHSVGNIRVGR